MTQTIILSVEIDVHLSVYSTGFYVLLMFACVHACISVVPMSNRSLLNSRESEPCACILGTVFQISLPITALTYSQFTVLNLFACRSVEICQRCAAFKSRVLNNHRQKWIPSCLCFQCHEGYYIDRKVSAVVILFGRVSWDLFSCHFSSR